MLAKQEMPVEETGADGEESLCGGGAPSLSELCVSKAQFDEDLPVDTPKARLGEDNDGTLACLVGLLFCLYGTVVTLFVCCPAIVVCVHADWGCRHVAAP